MVMVAPAQILLLLPLPLPLHLALPWSKSAMAVADIAQLPAPSDCAAAGNYSAKKSVSPRLALEKGSTTFTAPFSDDRAVVSGLVWMSFGVIRVILYLMLNWLQTPLDASRCVINKQAAQFAAPVPCPIIGQKGLLLSPCPLLANM